MRLLIDGDILLYQASSAVEVEVDWGNDLWSLAADLREAQQTFVNMYEELMDALRADESLICLSSATNFRKTVNPHYKVHRKSKRKPTCFKPLKAWVSSQFSSRTIADLEADDVMGIEATADPKSVMVTIDKDLHTIPGIHWNQNKRDEGLQEITQDQADRMFYMQTLAGDAVDGYSGVPGIGMVKAAKLLDTHGCSWETVLDTYKAHGLSEDEALMNARCAKILTNDLWNPKTGVKLWTPCT